MIAYYPRLREGAPPGLVPRFGGLPWGLPPRLWPTCGECGRPMSHLAQLPGDGERMAIGDDQVLFLFKCEWDSVCSFWEHDGGANAAFVVPRRELGDAECAAPADAADGAPAVLREIAIVGWDARDDGAPPELEDAFYDARAFDRLPGEIAHPHDWAAAWRTKSGGVPYWTANGAQGVDGLPAGRLLLQVDNWLELEGGESVEIANFCSDGTAYVFVDRSRTPLACSLFINR
jgi:hypothetical protein